MKINKQFIKDLLPITLGTFIYAFGVVTINIPNHLAEGGITGITLILKNLFGINPAFSTLFVNVPLIIIGGKILGKRSFFYTVYGTLSMSVSLWIWQKIPFQIDLGNDLLVASLLAGLVLGFGCGLVYRTGGTTGGSDVIARIFEQNFGVQMGRSLLIFDVCVLLLSLTYIDIKRMIYTLIVAYVFSNVVNYAVDGAYAAKGILVFAQENEIIGQKIMEELQRGVSFFKGQGGYSNQEKNILYCVVSPKEIATVKRIISEADPNAFVSVINVHEALGEGFTANPKTFSLFRKKQSKRR